MSVRVVPIGKLFEKNTAGRQVGSGQCSTAECPLLGEHRETFAQFEFLPVLTRTSDKLPEIE